MYKLKCLDKDIKTPKVGSRYWSWQKITYTSFVTQKEKTIYAPLNKEFKQDWQSFVDWISGNYFDTESKAKQYGEGLNNG